MVQHVTHSCPWCREEAIVERCPHFDIRTDVDDDTGDERTQAKTVSAAPLAVPVGA